MAVGPTLEMTGKLCCARNGMVGRALAQESGPRWRAGHHARRRRRANADPKIIEIEWHPEACAPSLTTRRWRAVTPRSSRRPNLVAHSLRIGVKAHYIRSTWTPRMPWADIFTLAAPPPVVVSASATAIMATAGNEAAHRGFASGARRFLPGSFPAWRPPPPSPTLCSCASVS